MDARKKNATRLGAHVVFIDESGFLLMPSVRKTWAPRGQTPLLRFWQRHDKVSVISGLSVSPRRRRLGLCYQLHLANIRAPEVCTFLRHLLRHLRGAVIRDLCHAFPRLHLVRFPPYAPELNPDEGVWSLAKAELANGRPDAVEILRAHLLRSLTRLRRSQRALRGCIAQADLPLILS